MIPRIRSRDRQGAGYFGASRGTRTHRGTDFVCAPGHPVYALDDAMPGKVTKLGYPYRYDLDKRYVEITDIRGFRCRYFYVLPELSVGDRVNPGDRLGICQELDYPGMTPHYHFEVIDDGTYVDPIIYLSGGV